MNSRKLLFVISIICLSFLTVFYEWFVGEFIIDWILIIGIIFLTLVHLKFFKVYGLLLGNKKIEVSNGLFISSLTGLILIISFIIWSISNYYLGINKLYYSLIIPFYIFLMIICFISDLISNETKKIKRLRVLLGSFVFYLLNSTILIIVWLIV